MTNEVSLLAAFFAGILSLASPCVLPMVPVYIVLLTGSGGKTSTSDWRFISNTACFMLGFTLIFLLMGATASILGHLFLEYQETIRKAGALFMIFMGVCLAGVFRVSALSREWRPRFGGNAGSPFGALLLGVAVTAGWTPCTGPILASVLAYAGMDATLELGVYLLLAYAAGFAVPFLLIAAFCNRYLNRIRSWYRWLPLIQKLAGAVLVVIGILLYFNWLQSGILSIINGWQ